VKHAGVGWEGNLRQEKKGTLDTLTGDDYKYRMELRNKVFVGDCSEVLRQFPEQSIGVCLTDPPYNYEFIGKEWDHGEIQRRVNRIQNSKTLVKNIPYGSGLAGGVRSKRWYEKNRENVLSYQKWCVAWGAELFRVCAPGALVGVFNSTRTIAHVQVALEEVGFYARDCIVYRRQSGIPKGLNLAAKLREKGMENPERWNGWHSCLRNEWEAIAVLQKPLENNYTETVLKYGVGVFHAENGNGQFLSNIIENIPKEARKEEEYGQSHCTPKPLALMERLVELFVPNDPDILVLDPFAGTGTTLVAAKKLGRSFVGVEINSEYAGLIERRLTVADGKTTASGQPNTFELFAADNNTTTSARPETLELFAQERL
jgi:site-specific DNA-methyltransferase (adenine-specific)